ncbi:phage tail tape measure protein [Paenibacillus naphthalenovorans]|uniref:phage tail tape measure protein n=1 Tax=Paenibacillus naphthalenovorans TaxID=162209 RepID=UPI003D2A5D0E
MANTSLQVALVLTAVNNMGSALRSARQQVSDLGHTYDSLRQKAQQMNDLRTSGLQDVAAGAAMLAPIESAVRSAGQLEYAMKRLEIASYDAAQPVEEHKRQLKELEALAVELGASTAFSSTEAANGMTELIRSGMAVRDVLNGGAKAAIYLAQTAEVAPDVAASSVAKLSNMFNLAGDKMMQVADDINRAANASSAGVQEIMYSMRLAGASASALGLDVKETSLLIGTLYNKGLGEQSGSSLNNLLLSLTNIKDQAGEAMAKLGLLKNAQFKRNKDGTLKLIQGDGVVFDEKGQIKSAQALVDAVRAAFKSNGLSLNDIVDAKGNLLPQEELDKLAQGKQKLNEVILLFKQAFGEEGMRAAIALAAEGKGSYEETAAAAQRAMDIQKQVQELQGTMLGLFEQISGAWETFNASSGGLVTEEVKQLAKEVLQFLDVLGQWVAAHPELTANIIKTIAILAGLRIGLGALKLIFGMTMGPLFSFGAGLVRFGKYARDAGRAFLFFRSVGNGVFGAGLKALFKDFPRIQQLIQVTANGMTRLGRLGWSGFMFVARGAGSALAAVGRFAMQGAVWLARHTAAIARNVAMTIAQRAVWAGQLAVMAAVRVATVAWTAAQWALNAAMSANPIGLIVIAIAALVAGVVWAYNRFEWFRNGVQFVFNMIANAIQSVIAWFGSLNGWVQAAIAVFAPFIGIPLLLITHWEDIKTFFANLPGQIMGFLSDLPSKALEWGKNLVTMLGDGIANGVQYVKDKVVGVADAIKDFLGFGSPTKLGPASRSDRWAPNLMNMFTDGIESGVPNVARSARSAADQLRSNLSGIEVPGPKVADPVLPQVRNVIPLPVREMPQIETQTMATVRATVIPFPNVRRAQEQEPTLLRRPQTTSINDNRKIDITIYAKDAKEAEIGVRRAVDDKYLSSRLPRPQIWQQGSVG